MKDLISRQAAVDACIRVREFRAYDEIEEIKALPSAEPEYEELTPEEAASEIASGSTMSAWYWLDDMTRLKQMGYAICRKKRMRDDLISRKAAIDELKQCTMHCVTPDSYHIDVDDATHRISVLPSAQSDNSNESEPPHSCKTCKYNALHWYEEPCDSCTGDSWRPYGGDQDE